jgi:hypothetical protein
LCPLLVVDGGFWCGFCDAAFFDNVLHHRNQPIPTIYDEENIVKERCITETTPISTIYDEENVISMVIGTFGDSLVVGVNCSWI